MTFTTITFFVFLILFFGLYWLIAPRNKNWRNLLITLGGYIFYGWWDWRFLVLLIFSSTIDFSSGLLIHSAHNSLQRRIFLGLSLVVNLCLLGFFKYCDFFITSANDLLHLLGYQGSMKTLEIILPVGLSFYTFQSMSYALDVYKGKLKPTKNILDFFAFVSFFPQLVAGPIERAVNMLPQFQTCKKFNYSQAVDGLRLILWGLFKKMVIADSLAIFANQFFNAPLEFDTLSAWIGVFAFTFQIYCDFSGYSDIAMGCAKLLGFEIMVNFRTPYFSKTFTEFWQRWHISLSSWFRDYVFIPLGGNRKSLPRYLLNLMITFLLSGLWHGANYTYIMWGFLHGTHLAREKLYLRNWTAFKWIPGVVFLYVMLAWVPFRAKNILYTGKVYAAMFNLQMDLSNFLFTGTIHNYMFLVVFTLFIATERWLNKKTFAEKIILLPKTARWLLYYLLVGCIILFGDFKNAPSFIYFQF